MISFRYSFLNDKRGITNILDVCFFSTSLFVRRLMTSYSSYIASATMTIF